MSNKIVFPQKSEIRKKLLQEAATLEKNSEFMGHMAESKIKDILFIMGFESGRTHRVYPSEETSIKFLTEALEEDFGIDLNFQSSVIECKEENKPMLPRRIVFHNRQAIGDILMFSCAIRDFKRAFPEVEVQVQSTVMHIWDFNPYINRDKWVEIINPLNLYEGKEKLSDVQKLELNKKAIEIAIERDMPVLVYIGSGKATNASNRSDLHFSNAYRISMETVLGVRIPQGPIRADIYMSETEYSAPAIVEPPYWLITAGEKGDWTCKTFAFQKWQEVVEKLPQIKFVQLGSTGHKHPELSGPNVINFIGKTQDRHTGLRDLFNLFNYCEGSMGLVSFQMHLAAAFNKPCIVIAGAREPVHFTRYPGQQYLASDGCLPCTVKSNDEPTSCWFCKIERCPVTTKFAGQEVPLCADLFTSDDIVRSVLRYYEGGRLSFNKPIGRSKLVGVIKPLVEEIKPVEQAVAESGMEEKKKLEIKKNYGPPVAVTTSNLKVVPNVENLWGMEWGGGSLTDKDWTFIKDVLQETKAKTVLEFGAGLSTLLFNSMGLDTVTFETHPGWITKIHELEPDCDIRQWDGKNWEYGDAKCDLAFVDGPAGGANREYSTMIASKLADVVIVHDAGREWEKKWQQKYLEPSFYLASKGGHRCHFWKRGQLPKIELTDENSDNTVKFVFNGRGDGGAERSTRWMMEQFVKMGKVVQYISPNPQPSGTFRRIPVHEVQFSNNLEELKRPCGLMFLYANDWIWEFNKLEEVFSGLQAKRKVMAVNYKVGGVGQAKWTLGWDKYLFLNRELETEVIHRHKQRTGLIPLTRAMAPPTDLSDYFDNYPDYGGKLRLIRHSSQGDVKYPKTIINSENQVVEIGFNEMLTRIMEEVPECEVFLMPAPSFLSDAHKANDRIHTFLRNQPSVKEFLSYGNAFWYKLPIGYTEGGPKVIMEAQASGLPVIAENHSGAKDRLVNGGGYLCNNFEEHLKAIKDLANNPDKRVVLGQQSRSHAEENYKPIIWVDEILGTVEPPLRCDMQMLPEGDFVCRL